MISVYTGIPGSGKSLKMANEAIRILKRNQKWFEVSGVRRYLVSNLLFSKEVEVEFNGFIKYWSDVSDLIKYRDVDVFWDEIATELDSTQWQNMSLEVKRWLQQHRKFGIDIYGSTQDFAMIDKSFRRMVENLYLLSKLIGSRDKSATIPSPKYIWGLVLVRGVDVKSYESDNNSPKVSWLPSFFTFDRSDIEIYDTTQEIKKSDFLPLNHVVRKCLKENCGFEKLIHA